MRLLFSIFTCLAHGAALLKETTTLDEAKKLLAPFLTENIKKLENADMEIIIKNQWFPLAHELVAASHKQGADLGFIVRKATLQLKKDADELVRALNPNYGIAQPVHPAFRWAQNNTAIFINVKFTARWNAPGALEVKEPVVKFTEDSVYFTGIGEHSGNKYKYILDLKQFDNLIPSQCEWSAASVGKLSLTLRKAWPRKWPRLLADKKHKMTNMSVWMEYQEEQKMDDIDSCKESPLSCKIAAKSYCPTKDDCVDSAKCGDCKAESKTVDNVCVGTPSSEGRLTFHDNSNVKGKLEGTIEVVAANKNAFDIDEFELWAATAEKAKLTKIVTIPNLPGEKVTHYLPEQAIDYEHIVVTSKNKNGELDSSEAFKLVDRWMPLDIATSVEFVDIDPEAAKVGGDVKIIVNKAWISSDIILAWGKTKTKKLPSDSYITTQSTITKVATDDGFMINVNLRDKSVPSGAKFILVFSKNEFMECEVPYAYKFEDKVRPCAKGQFGTPDCVQKDSVTATADTDDAADSISLNLSVAQIQSIKLAGIEKLQVYWGEGACDQKPPKKVGASVATIDLSTVTEDTASTTLTNLKMPGEATYLMVFPDSATGESRECESIGIMDESSTFNPKHRHLAKIMASMSTTGQYSFKKKMSNLLEEYGYKGTSTFNEIRDYVEKTVFVGDKYEEFVERVKNLNEEEGKKKKERDEKKQAKKEKKEKKDGKKEEL